MSGQECEKNAHVSAPPIDLIAAFLRHTDLKMETETTCNVTSDSDTVYGFPLKIRTIV